MERTISKSSRDHSSWFWLAFGVGIAIAAEVLAIRNRDPGIGISGIGIAILGVFGFLCSPSLTSSIRSIVHVPDKVDPKLAALAGVGALLNLIGLAITWLG